MKKCKKHEQENEGEEREYRIYTRCDLTEYRTYYITARSEDEARENYWEHDYDGFYDDYGDVEITEIEVA